MRQRRTCIAIVLIAVLTMGSKCNLHSKWSEVQDPDIQVAREILLTTNDVINAIDDIVAEKYTGSDEDFERLGRTVCALETMQMSVQGAWKVIRVWELAKADARKRSDAGQPPLDDLQVYGTEWLNYAIEIGGLAVVARNLAVEWGGKPPKVLDTLIKMIGYFVHEEVKAPALDCQEIAWTPQPTA